LAQTELLLDTTVVHDICAAFDVQLNKSKGIALQIFSMSLSAFKVNEHEEDRLVLSPP